MYFLMISTFGVSAKSSKEAVKVERGQLDESSSLVATDWTAGKPLTDHGSLELGIVVDSSWRQEATGTIIRRSCDEREVRIIAERTNPEELTSDDSGDLDKCTLLVRVHHRSAHEVAIRNRVVDSSTSGGVAEVGDGDGAKAVDGSSCFSAVGVGEYCGRRSERESALDEKRGKLQWRSALTRFVPSRLRLDRPVLEGHDRRIHDKSAEKTIIPPSVSSRLGVDAVASGAESGTRVSTERRDLERGRGAHL
jgi:hypothetical protein